MVIPMAMSRTEHSGAKLDLIGEIGLRSIPISGVTWLQRPDAAFADKHDSELAEWQSCHTGFEAEILVGFLSLRKTPSHLSMAVFE